MPLPAIDIFPWNDHFNTGLPEVDAQHHQLVQLLMEAELARAEPATILSLPARQFAKSA